MTKDEGEWENPHISEAVALECFAWWITQRCFRCLEKYSTYIQRLRDFKEAGTDVILTAGHKMSSTSLWGPLHWGFKFPHHIYYGTRLSLHIHQEEKRIFEGRGTLRFLIIHQFQSHQTKHCMFSTKEVFFLFLPACSHSERVRDSRLVSGPVPQSLITTRASLIKTPLRCSGLIS